MTKLIDEVDSEFLKFINEDSSDYDFPLAAVILSRILRIALEAIEATLKRRDQPDFPGSWLDKAKLVKPCSDALILIQNEKGMGTE